MIQILDKRNCVGCGNCMLSCPQNCIHLERDSEGFLYPQIDISKCVNCGHCNQACPVKQTPINNINDNIRVFGAINRLMDVRMNSSSGGLFSAFAVNILNHKGIVYGAMMTDSLQVKHSAINTENDLWKLQGSKYVQSVLGDSFSQLSDQLKTGVEVLFSGTPCQVKALYSFLGHRPTNLLSIEVVCHGVPSPMVFERYMKERKAIGMVFRKKERSWRNYDVEISFINGRIKREKAAQNLYMKGYLKDLFTRPSCSKCPAKYFLSGADITLGDFWGVGRISSGLSDDKGTSLCFLHTTKGIHAWNQIKHQLEFATISMDDAVSENPYVIQSVTNSQERDLFFSDISHSPVVTTLKKYVGEKPNETIKRHLTDIWNTSWSIALSAREKTYSFTDSIYSRLHRRPVVKGIEETLNKMIMSGCSVSRFGDGEMKHVYGKETWFQHQNSQLRQRLQDILLNNQEGLIVCVPSIFGNLSGFTESDRNYWHSHIIRYRRLWYQFLDCRQPYYDAFISRCYMPYRDKGKSAHFFDLWKLLWKNRDILILEGEKTRLGVGNDLFLHAKSIRRVLCPNTQAFSFYDQLLAETLKYDHNILVLIALGPTATVLAADLSRYGYQAIDIGHLDIEYEWFLQRAQCKVPIENKFVNEAGAGLGVGDCYDSKYLSEIVCRC